MINCAKDTFFSKSNEYDNNCSQSCPLECNSYHFKYEQSSLSFPSDFYTNHLQKNILKSTRSISEVKDSVAKVKIYYETLNYKLISEGEAITFTNLLSSVGGVLGLFLGMSWLSFIEIFEIIYEIVLTVVHHKK